MVVISIGNIFACYDVIKFNEIATFLKDCSEIMTCTLRKVTGKKQIFDYESILIMIEGDFWEEGKENITKNNKYNYMVRMREEPRINRFELTVSVIDFEIECDLNNLESLDVECTKAIKTTNIRTHSIPEDQIMKY